MEGVVEDISGAITGFRLAGQKHKERIWGIC